MAGKIIISDDCDRESEENMRKQKLMLGAILVAAGLLMGCAGTAKGNTEEEFYNILENNMLPVYESARRQGYEIWEY